MAQVETKRMPCARALFSFEGQSQHELNFSAGVSIMLLRRIDENWLEGQLDGKVGIFPANYVKIELGSPSVSHESALARSGKPYAIAVHPFQGGQAGDLSFNKGELVELITSVDSGWLKGRIQNRSGIFPASFVQIIKPLREVSKLTNGMVVSELASFSIGMNHSNNSDGDPSSPEYEESTDMVDELQPPVAKPRAMPRHFSAPSAIKMGVIRNERTSVMEKDVQEEKEEEEEEESDNVYENVSMSGGPSENHPTPSRSAPAPPNATDHQPQRFGTLPMPKPRKKASTLTRHQSSTDHTQNISSLESQLTIEQKMLESAENMLQAGPSPTKREKLEEAVKTHQMNIERIKKEIQDANVERQASQNATAAHATPPSRPRPPKSTPNQQEKMRSKTIDELVFTEKDFHHQMDLCTRKVLPTLKEVPDINTDILFGNLSDVTRLSCDFLTSLEDSCRNQQAVGEVFVTFAPKLRDVYAVYCRNHDTASATLEKYMETGSTAQRIRQVMDELRGEIQAWDLQSLLIKPVQRVLKYPLLLDKLAECTPSKHPDYKHVLEARVVIEKVAQDINEIKRRKDIVERYTGPTKDERRGTVSMHSLQKKVRRIQQAFTQLTGLRSKTVDPKFDELEQKVLSLETLLRTLVKDIGAWQDEIVHMVEDREHFVDGMALYCSDGQSTSLSNYQELIPNLKQAIKAHARFVKDHVTLPLDSLLSLFQDPLHLIHKRRDKLLDYDHMQYALEHAAEAEPEKIKQLSDDCLLAKRNYEALNTQLIEELPHFLEAAVKMLQHQLTVLVQAQYAFHEAVSKVFSSYFDRVEQSSELQLKHLTAVAQVSQKLVQLSFVPASLATNFTSKMAIPRRVSEGSVSPQVSPQASPRTLKSLVSPQRGAFIEEEPEIEEEGPPVGSKLTVLYDFEAQDEAELSVETDEVVTLLCPHDRIGCTEWWLVQTERGKGYVPATYLEENCGDDDESSSVS